ncbi:MAG: hypothetical protein R6W72_08120 [Desulfurivibrionaceae bacterium]
MGIGQINTIKLMVISSLLLLSDTGLAGNGEKVICTEPRPQVCTMEYDPVCATRDTGEKCLNTPCDNTEEATYSNGCVACADQRVFSYRPGSCESREDGTFPD